MMPFAALRARMPWTPRLLSGIYAYFNANDMAALWQDSARTTPVTTAGQAVGCIDDLSGGGHHLIQASAPARGIWNGQGIVMDGVDDYYREASAGASIVLPVYIAVAYHRATGTAASRTFFRIHGSSANDYVELVGVNAEASGSGRAGMREAVTANTALTATTGVGQFKGGETHVLDGLGVVGTMKAQVDNLTEVSVANAWVSGSTIEAPKIAIATGNTTGFAMAGVFMGGILTLSDPGADRAKAKNWLAARGGIAI